MNLIKTLVTISTTLCLMRVLRNCTKNINVSVGVFTGIYLNFARTSCDSNRKERNVYFEIILIFKEHPEDEL